MLRMRNGWRAKFSPAWRGENVTTLGQVVGAGSVNCLKVAVCFYGAARRVPHIGCPRENRIIWDDSVSRADMGRVVCGKMRTVLQNPKRLMSNVLSEQGVLLLGMGTIYRDGLINRRVLGPGVIDWAEA